LRGGVGNKDKPSHKSKPAMMKASDRCAARRKWLTAGISTSPLCTIYQPINPCAAPRNSKRWAASSRCKKLPEPSCLIDSSTFPVTAESGLLLAPGGDALSTSVVVWAGVRCGATIIRHKQISSTSRRRQNGREGFVAARF